VSARHVGTLLVLGAGFGALGLVPHLGPIAAGGFVLAAWAPRVRGLDLAGEVVTVLAVVVAGVAWWLGVEAPTVMGALLAWLLVHRRTVRAGPAADRVAVVIAALMLVTAAGVSRAPSLAPCVGAWTLGLPLALLGEGRAPVGLVLGTTVLAAALFALVPRADVMGATAPGAGVTGFSPEVQLGDLDALLDDPAEVFRASVEPAPEGRPYWRGVALDDFDGTRWRTDAAPNPGSEPPILPPLPLSDPALWTVDVQVVDSSEAVLFLPGTLRGYAGPRAARDPQGSWYAIEGEPAAFVAVVSPFADRRSVELPGERGGAGPIDPRIAELAREVAGEGPPAAQVARLSDHLRETYPYARRAYGGDDPLVEFLFERRGGHCEYFASALAVMVRAIGHPSRVVNGFVGGERNPITGQWVVRRRDAHSWVEVRLPEQGWVLFDPTPLDDDPAPSGLGPSELTGALVATWDSALAYDGVDQARAVATMRAVPWPWFLGGAAGIGVGGLARRGRRRERRGRGPGVPPSRWGALQATARQAIAVRAGEPVPAALPPKALAAWVEDHAAPLAPDYRDFVSILYDAVIGGRDDDEAYERAEALVRRLSG